MTGAPGRGAPMAGRVAGILVAVGLMGFLAAAALRVFGDGLDGPVVRPSVYSASAVGHRGLLELLRALDHRVSAVRGGAPGTAAAAGLYVIAEPLPGLDLEAALARSAAAPARLLIPPKRSWRAAGAERAGWLAEAPIARPATELVQRLLPGLEINRLETEPSWRLADGLPPPTLSTPQVLVGPVEQVLVGAPEGVLIGLLDADTLVISDPDLIANHGLDDGRNAELVIGALDAVARSGPVLFDETIHGFARAPSFWRTLFSFPWVIVALGLLLAAGVAAWGAARRFGPATPDRVRGAGGRVVLVRNAAGLLLRGGHGGAALERYAAITVRAVRRRLGAPSRLRGAALDSWLDKAARARGLETVTALRRAVATTGRGGDARLEMARRLHRWRREIEDGSARPHRAD